LKKERYPPLAAFQTGQVALAYFLATFGAITIWQYG
jgi:hypothetical protein